jgi:hypothetical protein
MNTPFRKYVCELCHMRFETQLALRAHTLTAKECPVLARSSVRITAKGSVLTFISSEFINQPSINFKMVFVLSSSLQHVCILYHESL